MAGLGRYCAAFVSANLDGVLVLSRPKYRELLLDLIDLDDAIDGALLLANNNNKARGGGTEGPL